MHEFGQLRARARTRAFAVSWFGCTLLLLLFVLGVVPAMLVGAALAGAISTAYVKARKQALVDKVCQKLGLSPQAFAPDRYLID